MFVCLVFCKQFWSGISLNNLFLYLFFFMFFFPVFMVEMTNISFTILFFVTET